MLKRFWAVGDSELAEALSKVHSGWDPNGWFAGAVSNVAAVSVWWYSTNIVGPVADVAGGSVL